MVTKICLKMDFIRFDKKVEHPLIVWGVANSESDTDSESSDTPKKVNTYFDTVAPKKINKSFDTVVPKKVNTYFDMVTPKNVNDSSVLVTPKKVNKSFDVVAPKKVNEVRGLKVEQNIDKNVVDGDHSEISNIKEKSSFNTTNNIFKPSSNSLFSMTKNTSVFESKDNNEKKTREESSFEFNFDTKDPIKRVDVRSDRQQDKVNIVENVDIPSLSPRVDNSFKKQRTISMKRDSNKSVDELLELRLKLEEIDEKISKQSELCLKCDRHYNEVTNAISIKLEKHISETRDVMSKHMDCVPTPIKNEKNVIDDYVMSRLLSLEQQINISSTESRISLVEDRIGITTPYSIHSVMNRLNKLESYFEGQKTSIRRLHQDNNNLLNSIRLNSQTLQANSLIADDRNIYLSNSLRQIDDIERRQRKIQQLIFICFTTAFVLPIIFWSL